MDNPAELVPAFQEHAATIRDTKRAQWTSVYYAFLVLAGLVTYFKALQPGDAPDLLKAIIWFADAAVALFTVWYIWSAHYSIERYRVQIQGIREKLSESFQEIIGEADPSRDIVFPLIFSLVLWVGTGFLFWAVFPWKAEWLAISLLALGVLMVVAGICARDRERKRWV